MKVIDDDDDDFDDDDRKTLAPRKSTENNEKPKKKSETFSEKKKNWRRKIEICKSSEMRGAEVSWRSERRERGKRTFEVRSRLGGIREA